MSSDKAAVRLSQRVPLLAYLYGPPAAGKLTIAEKVRDLTGFGLFHNHLTVNAIREVLGRWGHPFVELLRRVRLGVFATAMRTGVSIVALDNQQLGVGWHWCERALRSFR